jgi:histidinol-phosphate aminotransferase
VSYFRENIERMAGYTPGFQPKGEGWVKLNTNENPFPPSPKVIGALHAAIDGRIRLYPDPLSDRVREKIGVVYGVDRDCLIVGNGCDEVLAIAARSFVGEGDRLLMTRPTYTLNRVLGEIQGAEVVEVPLKNDFSLPEEIFSREAELTCISNPNPPSGILYGREEMERLVRGTGGVVVIDEAYVDFAEKDCLEMLKSHDNVLIARSFSKYLSMAGLRLGFAIGDRELIAGMMKVKDSYNVNCLSQVAAVAALDDIGYYREIVREVCQERESLTQGLERLGWKVYPSQANFVFAVPDSPPALQVYEGLYQRKILVRYFDTPETRHGLRITIGTPEQNQRLLEAIEEIGGEKR